MNETSSLLDPKTLLANRPAHRLVIEALLTTTAGLDRFQPAGFPEIGHVIYKAPRPDGTTQEVCIVDSAASMANHLETVCLASPHSLELADELQGLPYVQCLTDEGWPTVRKTGPHRLVVTSLSEGHRLASTYFLEGKLVDGSGNITPGTLLETMRADFGIADLGKKSHPLPEQWWAVFRTIFARDPNSLVHGILFPALQIKIPRALTAHLEAFGANRVPSAGVKFDKLGKTNSGQPIFAVDEETATEIRATFVLDLALVRSYGRSERGLSDAQKELLVALSLWKIAQLLSGPFRYRTNCDLEMRSWQIKKTAGLDGGVFEQAPAVDIAAAIRAAGFATEAVTKVYWPANELFKKGGDEPKKGKGGVAAPDEDGESIDEEDADEDQD